MSLSFLFYHCFFCSSSVYMSGCKDSLLDIDTVLSRCWIRTPFRFLRGKGTRSPGRWRRQIDYRYNDYIRVKGLQFTSQCDQQTNQFRYPLICSFPSIWFGHRAKSMVNGAITSELQSATCRSHIIHKEYTPQVAPLTPLLELRTPFVGVVNVAYF